MPTLLIGPLSSAEVVEHDGSHGIWLRATALEVFVAIRPEFELLSLKHPDHPSLMADSSSGQRGLRLAIMEPDQIPESFEPGKQEAQIISQSENAAEVQLESANGLRYSVSLKVHESDSALQLHYTLENVSETEREVACWSLMSFARDGHIVVPLGEDLRSRRQLVIPWWTAWPQTVTSFGRYAMVLDPAPAFEGGALKIGVITPGGWAAFVRDGHALVSHSPFLPDATYPEDGANISVFVGESHCETEQMSPLMRIAPGGHLRHSETLRWMDLGKSLPDTPDDLRALIESQLNLKTPDPT